MLNKLNFSPFRSNVENIDTKMYLHGFQERMLLIQEQCTWKCISVQVNILLSKPIHI